MRALKVGAPLALQECLTQISFLALCAFVNRLGLTASSGYGVACKIVNFAMLVPSSLMQSMASFVSQNVGAGKEKRAKKASKYKALRAIIKHKKRNDRYHTIALNMKTKKRTRSTTKGSRVRFSFSYLFYSSNATRSVELVQV